jgi:diguanylate cyclase (GGDEF)-like protein
MDMTAAEARAFKSLNRQEGQYSLLLDENFDIVWHSESLTGVLGFDDLRGRSSVDFVHADDLELALSTMLLVNKGDDVYTQADARYAPAAADMRLIDVHGVWHTFEVTTYNYLDDPDVRAVLCTCKLVRDRSDVARSIELLATGADMVAVLPIVARLADRSVGSTTRVAIAWRDGGRVHVAMAPDEHVMDPVLAGAAELVWTLGIRAPITIDDLNDPRLGGVGALAAEHGFRAAYLVPIKAPSADEIIGAMILWGVTSVDFDAESHTPIHVAVQLAALAIADSRTKRELRWSASHDPLTKLINRAEFEHRLDAMAGIDIVLLYIDLDDFKPINDIYGHPVGDTVLIEVGKRITRVLGGADFVGRLGGDEFAVVCVTDDLVHGRNVADRIVTELRKPIMTNGVALRIGASVGVAVGAQPLIPAVLVQKADEALYAAKHSGKNTVRVAI